MINQIAYTIPQQWSNCIIIIIALDASGRGKAIHRGMVIKLLDYPEQNGFFKMGESI